MRTAPDTLAEHGRSPATPEGPSVRPVRIPEPESLDSESVLDLYERARLPAPARKGRAEPAASLLALADRYDAFILDGYGVINVGPEPIPGIGSTIRTLRAAGREVMVLTNGAGRPSRTTARRYAGWGLDMPERLVVSSRDALEASLAVRPRPGLWGVMALPDSELETLPVETALLEDDESLYRRAEGFIFIRSEGWSTKRSHAAGPSAARLHPAGARRQPRCQRPLSRPAPVRRAGLLGAAHRIGDGGAVRAVRQAVRPRVRARALPAGCGGSEARAGRDGGGRAPHRHPGRARGGPGDGAGHRPRAAEGARLGARAARAGIFPDHVVPEA